MIDALLLVNRTFMVNMLYLLWDVSLVATSADCFSVTRAPFAQLQLVAHRRMHSMCSLLAKTESRLENISVTWTRSDDLARSHSPERSACNAATQRSQRDCSPQLILFLDCRMQEEICRSVVTLAIRMARGGQSDLQPVASTSYSPLPPLKSDNEYERDPPVRECYCLSVKC